MEFIYHYRFTQTGFRTNQKSTNTNHQKRKRIATIKRLTPLINILVYHITSLSDKSVFLKSCSALKSLNDKTRDFL